MLLPKLDMLQKNRLLAHPQVNAKWPDKSLIFERADDHWLD